jgi:hypothetical protein
VHKQIDTRDSIRYATYGLVLLAALKIFAVFFSTPIMGYANNYDFIRQSGCVGLWQAYKDKPKTSSNPEAPVNALALGQKDPAFCIKSIDNVFPSLAAAFHSDGDTVDFREISIWKAALLFSCLWMLLANLNSGIWKLAVASVFFLVFGDIANLLYANTLYLEFSVLVGCFFSLWSAALYLCGRSKPRASFSALSVLALLWLGFSKQQYMPLASVLALIISAALMFRWRARKSAALFLLISLCVPFIYNKHSHADRFTFANNTDTFLWTVLPEADDKEAALAALGLPKTCMNGIGKHWYEPGIQDSHPCREVQQLSRIKLIKLFFMDPSTFINPMRKAIAGTIPFYPPYLGHLENPQDAASVKYLLVKATSFSTVAAKMPERAFYWVALLSMLLSPCVLAARNSDAESDGLPLAMLGLGGMLTLYSVSSSVFGDGYTELQKHGVGFLIGFSFQLTALALFLIHYGHRGFHRARQPV